MRCVHVFFVGKSVFVPVKDLLKIFKIISVLYKKV